MYKYNIDAIKLYAYNHTIKEIQCFFNFPSYDATKRYLLKHHIQHLQESREGRLKWQSLKKIKL